MFTVFAPEPRLQAVGGRWWRLVTVPGKRRWGWAGLLVVAVALGLAVYWPVEPGEECALLGVHDGDSITLQCAQEKLKIRLHCIDAPELAQAPWGKESRDYLRQLASTQVRLERLELDRYGRTLARVWAGDGPMLNLALVEAGRAAVYPRYCDDQDFYQAETRARAAQLGIWASPGLHQRPWDWRRR